jgi:peptidyl-prolyl cis-trans isomerase B (cyclophilin B)
VTNPPPYGECPATPPSYEAGQGGYPGYGGYPDSQLPPSFTVFGSMDSAGLATVDKIATGGVQGRGDDGKPVTGVTIESVRLN